MGLHPFTTYVLRNYYKATGWNEDNLYSNLTRSSDAILDFPIPRGLAFSISKSPNALFRTTYSMNALPSLTGAVGYIFSSCALNLRSSGEVKFKDLLSGERFRVYGVPRRPELREDGLKDYLLSGLLYIPERRLDSFYSKRLSSTMQFNVSAITQPHPAPYNPTSSLSSSSLSHSSANNTSTFTNVTNMDAIGGNPSAGEFGTGSLLLSLQHDTGRWGTEYTWDSDGSVLGVRVLRNFGRLAGEQGFSRNNDEGSGLTENGNGNWKENSLNEGTGDEAGESFSGSLSHASTDGVSLRRRVDEEEIMGTGLRGRISAGAEFYVSPENTAGMSVGVRFSTIPDVPPPIALRNSSVDETLASSSSTSHPSSSSASSASTPPSASSTSHIHPTQPPTTISAIFNPLTGHIISAYAARVSRDLTLCSRFSFNMNSYESEWTMGGEYWLRSNSDKANRHEAVNPSIDAEIEADSKANVSAHPVPTKSGSDSEGESLFTLEDKESGISLNASPSNATIPQVIASALTSVDEIQGVIKAKLSTSADIAMLWEGRIRNVLVSLGVISNLANRSKPITAIGLELAYFSSETD